MFKVVIRQQGAEVGQIVYKGQVILNCRKKDVSQMLGEVFSAQEQLTPADFVQRVRSLRRFSPKITWELQLD